MYKKITAQKNDTKITVIFAGTGTSQTNPFPEEIAIECKHRLGIAKTGKVTFARFINWKSFTATDLKLYLPIPESISDNEVKALIEELLYKR